MLMSHLDNEVYSWQDLSRKQPPRPCSEDAGARKSLYVQIRVLLGLETPDWKSSRVTRSWQGKAGDRDTENCSSTCLTACMYLK